MSKQTINTWAKLGPRNLTWKCVQNGLKRDEDTEEKIIRLYKRHVAVDPELVLSPYF